MIFVELPGAAAMKPNAWFHLHATTEMYFEWQGKHAGENSSNAYIVEGKVSRD